MSTLQVVSPPDATPPAMNPTGLEQLRMMLGEQVAPPDFATTTQILPLRFDIGVAVFEGRPSTSFLNPMGLVHGGWIATLLDTAMACAVHTTLDPGETYSTIEMKSVFVRAVKADSGPLLAEGSVLHAGSRVAHAEGRILDAAGELVAYGSETCLLSKRPPNTRA